MMGNVVDFNKNLTDLSTKASHWLEHHGFNILIILLGAWLLRRFGAGLINRVLKYTMRADLYPSLAEREKRLKTLNSLVRATLGVAVYLIAAVMIVGELGLNTAPLLASAGVLGVAIGFGAQSLIRDFVSGVFIIVENQYRIGDMVELGDFSGVVETLTIRTTVLRDQNDHIHYVPNGSIVTTTNKTLNSGLIEEEIVLSGDTDIELVEHIINHVGDELRNLASLKHLVDEAPHFAGLKGFQDKGIIVQISGKAASNQQTIVVSELYKHLLKAFNKYSIKFVS